MTRPSAICSVSSSTEKKLAVVCQNRLVLMLLLLLVSSSVSSSSSSSNTDGEQKFVVEPSDMTVAAGRDSSVLLPCRVQNKAGLLQWTRDEFGLGPERDLVGYERYKMIGSDQDGNYSLHISPVTLEDDATFQCQVMASNIVPGIRSRVAKVTVQVPPESPVIVQGPRLRTTAGMQLNLECESNGGKPAAEVAWLDYKGDVIGSGVTAKTEAMSDGKRYNSKATLSLTPTREHDGKTLTCRSKSAAIAKPMTVNISLEVKYAPEVTLTSNNPKIVEFDSVTFTCAAKANPDDVVFTWYRDNVVIPGNHTVTMTLTRLTREFHSKAISCEVRNAVGKTKASTTLNVLYGPKFTTPPSPVAADLNMDVTLNCQVSGNPKPDIVWTFERSNRVMGTESKLSIKGVTPEKSGRYRCRATVPGFPEIEDYYNVLLKGPPVIRSQLLQYGLAGDTLTVECNVRSVPPPIRIRWFHDDKELDPDRNARYHIEQESMEDGVRNLLLVYEGRETDFGHYNCTATNDFGSDHMAITLKKQKILPLMIILASAIGVVTVIVAVTIVIVLFLRRHKKISDDDDDHEPEKQSKASDRSSNDSDLKVEIRTSSSLSNNDSEAWDENSVDPRRVSTAHDNFRYSTDYTEPAFPPKVELQNNNGYIPYVDYQRDYSPPSLTDMSRGSYFSGTARVDPRYQAAYANPYLRSPSSSLPPPQAYGTGAGTPVLSSPTSVIPLTATAGGGGVGSITSPRTETPQKQYITSSQVPVKPGTLATHV